MTIDISSKKPAPESLYLGDGVYASFDGYQIWLAANDHRNKVIALEPAVMESLIEYSKKVFGQEEERA